MPTRLTKPTRWLAALAAAALILSQNACTEDNGGLPSVGPSTPTTGEVDEVDLEGGLEVDLEKVAQAYYGCMSDAGLPVKYGATIEGRSVLVQFDDQVSVISVNKRGAVSFTPAVAQYEREAFQSQPHSGTEDDPKDAKTSSVESEPFLQVEGVDHSETWARCLDSSGYDEDAVFDTVDTSGKLTDYNSLLVDASNKWAKCARENGHPNVIDAHMPRSEAEYPAALLPASITEERIRQLLEVCPTFDPAIYEANEKLVAEQTVEPGTLPDGYREQPSVGFDFPGFDGVYNFDFNGVNNFDPSTLSPEAAATYERLSHLYNVLREAEMEHFGMPGASAIPGGGIVGTFTEGEFPVDPTGTPG